jgi:hypothetical protein
MAWSVQDVLQIFPRASYFDPRVGRQITQKKCPKGFKFNMVYNDQGNPEQKECIQKCPAGFRKVRKQLKCKRPGQKIPRGRIQAKRKVPLPIEAPVSPPRQPMTRQQVPPTRNQRVRALRRRLLADQ